MFNTQDYLASLDPLSQGPPESPFGGFGPFPQQHQQHHGGFGESACAASSSSSSAPIMHDEHAVEQLSHGYAPPLTPSLSFMRDMYDGTAAEHHDATAPAYTFGSVPAIMSLAAASSSSSASAPSLAHDDAPAFAPPAFMSLAQSNTNHLSPVAQDPRLQRLLHESNEQNVLARTRFLNQQLLELQNRVDGQAAMLRDMHQELEQARQRADSLAASEAARAHQMAALSGEVESLRAHNEELTREAQQAVRALEDTKAAADAQLTSLLRKSHAAADERAALDAKFAELMRERDMYAEFDRANKAELQRLQGQLSDARQQALGAAEVQSRDSHLRSEIVHLQQLAFGLPLPTTENDLIAELDRAFAAVLWRVSALAECLARATPECNDVFMARLVECANRLCRALELPLFAPPRPAPPAAAAPPAAEQSYYQQAEQLAIADVPNRAPAPAPAAASTPRRRAKRVVAEDDDDEPIIISASTTTTNKPFRIDDTRSDDDDQPVVRITKANFKPAGKVARSPAKPPGTPAVIVNPSAAKPAAPSPRRSSSSSSSSSAPAAFASSASAAAAAAAAAEFADASAPAKPAAAAAAAESSSEEREPPHMGPGPREDCFAKAILIRPDDRPNLLTIHPPSAATLREHGLPMPDLIASTSGWGRLVTRVTIKMPMGPTQPYWPAVRDLVTDLARRRDDLVLTIEGSDFKLPDGDRTPVQQTQIVGISELVVRRVAKTSDNFGNVARLVDLRSVVKLSISGKITTGKNDSISMCNADWWPKLNSIHLLSSKASGGAETDLDTLRSLSDLPTLVRSRGREVQVVVGQHFELATNERVRDALCALIAASRPHHRKFAFVMPSHVDVVATHLATMASRTNAPVTTLHQWFHYVMAPARAGCAPQPLINVCKPATVNPQDVSDHVFRALRK